MNEITRPTLYGSQHDIRFIDNPNSVMKPEPSGKYVIVGHCCESSDLLTCIRDHPEQIREQDVPQSIKCGDFAIIRGTGAYCSSMSFSHYNSFPRCAEVMMMKNDALKVIRKAESIEDVMRME